MNKKILMFCVGGSVEEWSVLENGTNVSVTTTYPLINATRLRQDPLYAKNVVFILNLLTMGKIKVFFYLFFFISFQILCFSQLLREVF